jgi:hypothetical protein
MQKNIVATSAVLAILAGGLVSAQEARGRRHDLPVPTSIGVCFNARSGELQLAPTAARCNRNEVFVPLSQLGVGGGQGPWGRLGPAATARVAHD